MPVNPSGPVRRAQLIAPFGVGAMVVVPGGTSLIVGGLDYWYKSKSDRSTIDPQEFIFEEWRLQSILHVNHFRLPPDFRELFHGQKVPNTGITIPAFRFPTWHFCSDKDCRLLYSWPVYARGIRGRLKCPECAQKKKTRYMFQVPFVAMCENGHLQDFPWNEWVHYEVKPACSGPLRLISTGSATLAGQKVKCDACGKERTLSGITSANPNGTTTLSNTLAKDTLFHCRGIKPWLGPGASDECNAPLRGSLRSASNLYYAQVYSSIYLPKFEDTSLQELEIQLQSPPLSTLVSLVRGLGQNHPGEIEKALRIQYPKLLLDFTSAQVIQVLDQLAKGTSSGSQQSQPLLPSEDARTSFRRAEYTALRIARNDHLLKIKQGDPSLYEPTITKHFSRIMLISKLQETRAFAGLTRIFPENEQDQSQRQAMLWKEFLSTERWLPAYKVFGEGIFFEFAENPLSSWENRPDVVARAKPLVDRYKDMQDQRHLQDRPVNPRFILLHTFAHLVMNRLTFECGYSSAALRERLYVSNDPDAPMSGVLIYTADGDSEGTMGGLVRMGKPGYIEPVIQRALEGAKWCSADPVCMEMGKSRGQGPDSCNLAACHNCALVPETACEEFNRFLDRGLLVGSFENPGLGFFYQQTTLG